MASVLKIVIYMYIGQKLFDFVEILLLLQMLLRNTIQF